MTDGTNPVPGWYPDPEVPGGERYWDGVAWSEHRRPAAPPSASWGGAPAAPPTWGSPTGAVAQLDTWLWQSILATIFCCQPLGIVAIVFSAQAGSARDAGNLDIARRRADQARTWTLVSVGVGVAAILGFVLFVIAGASTTW